MGRVAIIALSQMTTSCGVAGGTGLNHTRSLAYQAMIMANEQYFPVTLNAKLVHVMEECAEVIQAVAKEGG